MKSLLSDLSLPFAILFLCIAAGCFYIAKKQEAHAQALIGEGQIAAALLVNKTTFTSSGTHKYANFGDKGPTTYTLHYQFTVPESNTRHEARSDVHPDVWNAVQVGQHYQIIYSSKDPSLTSLFNGQDFIDGARLAYWIAGVCFVFALVSATLYLKLKN